MEKAPALLQPLVKHSTLTSLSLLSDRAWGHGGRGRSFDPMGRGMKDLLPILDHTLYDNDCFTTKGRVLIPSLMDVGMSKQNANKGIMQARRLIAMDAKGKSQGYSSSKLLPP